ARDAAGAAEDWPRLSSQAEVQELGPRLRKHHVAGLDVAVDQAMHVGLVEGVSDLDADAEDLLQRQGTLLQPGAERLSVEVLEDEVVGSVLSAGVVQDADVGMAQAGDGPGFALESPTEVAALGQVLGQHLYGHGAVEARVPGTVDLAHAARTDRRLDFVGTETGAGLYAHGIRSPLAGSPVWHVVGVIARVQGFELPRFDVRHGAQFEP